MSNEYELMQQRIAKGWNTWNTRSVLSHVLLPEGFALNIGLREYIYGQQLKEALIGRKGPDDEKILAGPHAFDGTYSELTIQWLGNEISVRSATVEKDLVLLITPLAKPLQAVRPPLLIVEGGILWNRPGYVTLNGETLVGHHEGGEISVYATQTNSSDAYVWSQGPYLSMELDRPIGISTGHERELTEIQIILDTRLAQQHKQLEKYGEHVEVYKTIQRAMAWNTIYDPENQRIISPVSRIWNVKRGGFVLFEWDNYFAAYMAAVENKEIAYANAVEMTRAITENGMVPNFAMANGVSSRDRSEPPVGALVCREIYRIYSDIWFLQEVFPSLLRWNRWWNENRKLDGLLCWGSDPYQPVVGSRNESRATNQWQGGAYESGLDNSPMFDGVLFDTQKHLLLQHDVGLNGLYVADSDALADIAAAIGKTTEENELRQRADCYRKELSRLWDEQHGIYFNRRVDTGEKNFRISPTSFYPLIARAATQNQADRLVKEHFYNPDEFWGEWMIPSISRNDPAYLDQDYWRGRIWGPMNFLVYLGLRKYYLTEACHDLAMKSRDLLLKEWLTNGHVHENYNSETGEGCDKLNSDAFYHWGGLLGLIDLIEAGYLPPPEASL